MSNVRFLFVVMISLSFVVAGCGDESGGGSSNALSDAGQDADTSDAGADVFVDGGDAGDVGDAGDGTDTSAPSCEAFPAYQIAGTPETDLLADDSAQCGQAAYTWLDDEALGDITQTGVEKDFSAALIQGILSSENITAPREIAHDVKVVQYGYMTQDRGQMVEASAMVAFPTDRDVDAGPSEVLLLLHGTTGFTDVVVERLQRELAAPSPAG